MTTPESDRGTTTSLQSQTEPRAHSHQTGRLPMPVTPPRFPDAIHAVRWSGGADDGHLIVMDQRLLPDEEVYVDVNDVDGVVNCIRDMLVRGAPAIGCTAAYGMVIALRESRLAEAGWQQRLEKYAETMRDARPTAVNLRWAIEEITSTVANAADASDGDLVNQALARACQIHQQDIDANLRMGQLGAACLNETMGVLTHCNAGSLATGGYGTALGVIRSGWALGRINSVFSNETRPWLQGSRLTAWELEKSQIPVKLIVDSAAATLMRSGQVGCVIVGADRVAANGDVANKIGTYSLAVLAKSHGLKFMVVAPTSTIDTKATTGADIPIETRAANEVLTLGSKRIAAAGAGAWNPVFDITPADLVNWLVTERGVVEKPDTRRIAKLVGGN